MGDPIERAVDAIAARYLHAEDNPADAYYRHDARAVFASIDRDELARVMDEHYFVGVRDARWECACGAALGSDAEDVQDAHSRHQADAILAWLRGEPRD